MSINCMEDISPDFVEELKNKYVHLHQNPELSLQERETSAYLKQELTSLGYQVTSFTSCYGFFAELKNGDGPCVLYRTDMDALPVRECNSLGYKSIKEVAGADKDSVPVAHMCGHDMHMTIWLGIAKYFAENTSKLSGTLILLAQPAEEIAMGAKLVIQEAAFKQLKPDYCLAYHINPQIEAGKIGICKGHTMAGVDFIDVAFFGIGGHAAAPQTTIDPVVLASQFVLSAQTIVSRNIHPLDSAVVSISGIHGGSKHNITPDRVDLKLTIRWFKEEVRRVIIHKIMNIARSIAYGAELPESRLPLIKVHQDNNIPSLYNSIDLSECIENVSVNVLSRNNVVDITPQMYGEDFCYIAKAFERSQVMLIWVGSTDLALFDKYAGSNVPGLHSPELVLDIEKTISTGVKCMVNYVCQLTQSCIHYE